RPGAPPPGPGGARCRRPRRPWCCRSPCLRRCATRRGGPSSWTCGSRSAARPHGWWCPTSRAASTPPSPTGRAPGRSPSGGGRPGGDGACSSRSRPRSCPSRPRRRRGCFCRRRRAPGCWRRSMTGRTAGRTTGRPAYAELHAHSAFSFLDGASHPEELVAEADRLGLETIALTDHDGLYGVVRFSEAAKRLREAGSELRTAFGAELHLPAEVQGAPVLDPPTGVPDPRATHLLVLARSAQGYRSLSSAIATAHLEAGVKGAARYTVDGLGEAAAGEWLVLTGCRKGAVRRALTSGRSRAGRLAAARHELDVLTRTFGRDTVAVEITATGDPRD